MWRMRRMWRRIKLFIMKTILIHLASIMISIIWLITECQTYNPIFLKGPQFLKFYLILLAAFYISVFILKFLKESVSKMTLYFAIMIFIVGIVKLIRGLMLGKPIRFLVMILIAEIAVMLIFGLFKFREKLTT